MVEQLTILEYTSEAFDAHANALRQDGWSMHPETFTVLPSGNPVDLVGGFIAVFYHT